MKFTICCVLAILAVAVCVPLDKSKKNPGFEASAKCSAICTDETSKPLCATDGGKLNLSFYNECALKKYNCEQNKILTKKSDKECPNSQSIRFS